MSCNKDSEDSEDININLQTVAALKDTLDKGHFKISRQWKFYPGRTLRLPLMKGKEEEDKW